MVGERRMGKRAIGLGVALHWEWVEIGWVLRLGFGKQML